MITVVIPARDAAAFLPWTLDGLAEQDYDGDWSVVVVDNASSDNTAAVAQAAPVVSRVVRITGTGPADSRNAGVAASQGNRIAFLDADCRPTASWLSSGVRALERADLVQGAVAPDPSATLGPFDRTLWVPRFTGLFETANLFVSRETFDRVGGFKHWGGEGRDNARPFGEDVAFGWSVRRIGARTVFDPRVLAHHAVFERGPTGYVAERLRLRFFPDLARRVPELRESFFYRRWFLSRRTCAFDAAVLGSLMAAAGRRPWGLVAASPYLSLQAARWRGFGARGGARVALVDLAADAVGLAALVAGSVRTRAPVL